MIIYHLFICGNEVLKTNDYYEIESMIVEHLNGTGFYRDLDLWIAINDLILNHEYHLSDYDGNRIVDIFVETVNFGI